MRVRVVDALLLKITYDMSTGAGSYGFHSHFRLITLRSQGRLHNFNVLQLYFATQIHFVVIGMLLRKIRNDLF